MEIVCEGLACSAAQVCTVEEAALVKGVASRIYHIVERKQRPWKRSQPPSQPPSKPPCKPTRCYDLLECVTVIDFIRRVQLGWGAGKGTAKVGAEKAKQAIKGPVPVLLQRAKNVVERRKVEISRLLSTLYPSLSWWQQWLQHSS